jgi:NADP-reducing hydrogenase subunit HndB
MPRLKNIDELTVLRQEIQKTLREQESSETIITIGMGTCGLAAGAGEIFEAVEEELARRNLKATLKSVGCIGMCVREPLVDIQLAGGPRVTYSNVTPNKISRLIEEHVIQGRVVSEWAIGFVPPEW